VQQKFQWENRLCWYFFLKYSLNLHNRYLLNFIQQSWLRFVICCSGK
jgi:hypothetical protein